MGTRGGESLSRKNLLVRPHISHRVGFGVVFGPLAQSVEQRTFNPWVVGSIPTGPTQGLVKAFRVEHSKRDSCDWSQLGSTVFGKQHSSPSLCRNQSIPWKRNR